MGCLCFTGDILILTSVDVYLEHTMAAGGKPKTQMKKHCFFVLNYFPVPLPYSPQLEYTGKCLISLLEKNQSCI